MNRKVLAIPFALAFFLPCSDIYAIEYPKLKSIRELQFDGLQRQTLDYSCGAAALTILLNRYFGDSLTEHQILADIIHRLPEDKLLERTYEGFSMLDLKSAAENLGYSADGVILPREAVLALDGPVIILLRREKLNHFVVLKGVSQGRAFLADPARGNMRIPLYELYKEWQGETLIVGREAFGLPDRHGMNIPKGMDVAPESQTTRTLQHLPIR